MKIFSFLVGVAVARDPAISPPYTGSIWPKPQFQEVRSDVYTLDAANIKFIQQIIHDGPECDVIHNATWRYGQYFNDLASRIQPHKSSEADPRRKRSLNDDPLAHPTVSTVTLIMPGKCERIPLSTMEEHYDLHVDDAGVTIYSDTVWGILRGLQTLYQATVPIMTKSGAVEKFEIAGMAVQDYPRFHHRGFLMDTARHFQPVSVIKARVSDSSMEVIDGLEMNKFNVFHWHLVDDQNFPYDCKPLPDLAGKGAYYAPSRSHVYAIETVKDIVEYARVRGIRVVPEFDTPGHIGAAAKGQPGLATVCYDNDGKPTGLLGPADPTNEKNYDFMRTILTDFRNVFHDDYVHLGGDEVRFDCWKSNKNISDWMYQHNIAGDYAKLEEYWVSNVLNITKQVGFNYVVWEEVFDNGVQIDPETVVEVWLPYHPLNTTRDVTKAGFRALISSPWYLDYISYGRDWVYYYNYEPLAFNGTKAEEDLVIGGETCLWAEFVDASNYVSRLFPRASAVAERLWSARDVTDIEDAKARIHQMKCRMNLKGIHAEPADGPSACPIEFERANF